MGRYTLVLIVFDSFGPTCPSWQSQIFLLDKAASALDAESELVVQDALDNILEKTKITTIVIAHPLSTIHNADKINVILGGHVVEQGTHDHLMAEPRYYRGLVDKQEGRRSDPSSAPSSNGPSRSNSSTDLKKMDSVALRMGEQESGVPHLAFCSVTFVYPTRPK